MQGCDISTSTGTGVGAEGGSLNVQRCSVHGCKRHGIALFGSLDGSEGQRAMYLTIAGRKVNEIFFTIVLVADCCQLVMS